tara:strand:+ start:151 stop:1047 length:897 start_codon:yes stop_codon:yes gene_type:complete
VKGCGEHTYLEMHHIDGNRENNRVANLILLCDRHHKMSHAGMIDRRSLWEYKKLLSVAHDTAIYQRLERLERMIGQHSELAKGAIIAASAQPVSRSCKLQKSCPDRGDILHFVLKHAAIRHFERLVDVPFSHQVAFSRGSQVLMLDAIRQDDRLDHDYIIEVQYLSKSYMDAPVYGEWVEAKLELYELLTGRSAIGILMIVVGRDRMKQNLPLTVEGLHACGKRVELEVFTCSEIGFQPGSFSLSDQEAYFFDPASLQSVAERQAAKLQGPLLGQLETRYEVEVGPNGAPEYAAGRNG